MRHTIYSMMLQKQQMFKRKTLWASEYRSLLGCPMCTVLPLDRGRAFPGSASPLLSSLHLEDVRALAALVGIGKVDRMKRNFFLSLQGGSSHSTVARG